MKVLLVFSIILISSGFVSTKPIQISYDNEGVYTLKPEQYGWSRILIFEIICEQISTQIMISSNNLKYTISNQRLIEVTDSMNRTVILSTPVNGKTYVRVTYEPFSQTDYFSQANYPRIQNDWPILVCFSFVTFLVMYAAAFMCFKIEQLSF